jgi:predicted dehydrogenase
VTFQKALVKSSHAIEAAGTILKEVGVGIVGAGVRGVYCLAKAIAELSQETGLVVTGVHDAVGQRSLEAREYLEAMYRENDRERTIRVYDSFEDLLADEACRIVLVTSFTNHHRHHTTKALERGKVVYLDKPISVTLDDARQIQEAARENPLIMGFTRRYEKSWIMAKELLDQGSIGSLQMIKIDSVIPYSRYLQTWHRRKELSGGALNDKCSHHFDVFNWMAGGYPSFLTAVGGRSSVFPVEENAPRSCRECRRECEYRRDASRISDGAFVLQFPSWSTADTEIDRIDSCVYGPGAAEIEDHALVSVVYPSGVKASLFFSIFGPDTRDQETMLLVGEKGKIQVNRHEGLVTLYTNYGRKEELFDCRGEEFETSHFGADRDLVRALRNFYDGTPPVASATDGYVSLEMVLAAERSIVRGGQPVRVGESVSQPAV